MQRGGGEHRKKDQRPDSVFSGRRANAQDPQARGGERGECDSPHGDVGEVEQQAHGLTAFRRAIFSANRFSSFSPTTSSSTMPTSSCSTEPPHRRSMICWTAFTATLRGGSLPR